MAMEAISKIYEAENNAAEIVSEARRQAAQIIARANEDKSDTLKRAQTLSDEKARSEKLRVASEAEELVSNAAIAARADAKKLIAASSDAMEGAVSLILQEIFEKWQ